MNQSFAPLVKECTFKQKETHKKSELKTPTCTCRLFTMLAVTHQAKRHLWELWFRVDPLNVDIMQNEY